MVRMDVYVRKDQREYIQQAALLQGVSQAVVYRALLDIGIGASKSVATTEEARAYVGLVTLARNSNK